MKNVKKKKKPIKSSARKPGRKILLLIFIITAIYFSFKGISYLYDFVYNLKILKPKSITIFAPDNIKKDEITGVAKIPMDKNIFSIELDAVADRIKAHPWVKNVRVKRIFPNKIEISVDPKEVVALVKKDNSLYYIDQYGKLIDKFIPGYLNNSIVINSKDENKYVKAIELLNDIASTPDRQPLINYSTISEISIEDHDLFTLHVLNSDYKIKIINDKIDKRLKNIQKVMLDIKKRKEIIKVIDATLPGNRIVVVK